MAKKRGNGQGNARKRGATWTAIWTEGWETLSDGKLRQIRCTKGGFRTKTEALKYAANPTAVPETVHNLSYYWSIWSQNSLPKLGKSKQTAYNIAKGKAESLFLIPVDQLTIKQLQDTVNANAPTYYPAKDMKTVLSSLLKLAVIEQKIPINLAEYIVLPELDEKEMQPFTEIELHKLWDRYGSGDAFIGFVLLMIYTGMMPGELFNFKTDMVQWDTCEIIGCGLKTKKRKATPIVFPDIIAPVLLDLCQRSRSKIGNVLCMNRDKFYNEYHEALQRADVRDLPPYSCRHTTATALALGNIAPSVIQEVMRHTKFTTTQRYIHPDTAAARKAVNQMDKGKAQ